MEATAAACGSRTHTAAYSSFQNLIPCFISKPNYLLPPATSLSFKHLRLPRHNGLVAECECGQGVPAPPELEEDWVTQVLVGEGELKEKCCGDGSKGVVEVLECLEREAIMGKDEGRRPSDYSRRALIFDKSSTVFQALKNNNDDHPPPPP